jgi:RND superfamily putative drug exporter
MTIFERLGRFCARRRWWIVIAWAALALIALPLAPQASSVLRAGGFSSSSLEAAQARALLEDRIGLPTSAAVILIRSSGDARAGDPLFETAVLRAIERVPQAPYVTGILPHTIAPEQVSEDGRTVYEVVTLDLEPDLSPEAIEGLEDAIEPQDDLWISLAGGPAFYGDIQAVSEADLQRSEVVGLPLAGLALILVFGSFVAAGVPVVVGGVAVLVALGGITILASTVPMSIFALNIATLLGFGLGIDYALLLTSRFREELAARGGGHMPDGARDRRAIEDAVAVSVATAGRAVLFSGITVLLGLSGLLLFEFMVLRSVGLAGAIVVGLAVVGALTLLPAILAILGPRLERLPVPALGRRLRVGAPASDGASTGFWWRLANAVMDRPLAVFVPTMLVLVVLGLPFLGVRLNAPDASILPADVPSRAAYDVLVEEFGEGELGPLFLAIRSDGPATEPQNLAKLYAWSRRLQDDPRVKRVASIVDVDPRLDLEQYELLYAMPAGPPDRYVAENLVRTTDGDVTAFTVTTWHGPNAPESRALVEDLRDPDSGLAPPDGLDVLVAGGAAEVVDVVDRIAADFPKAALFIVLTTYAVLFLLLRSVVLPAKALVMNALSILASFGALVWIFQDGNLSALLGFVPLGFVETTLPVILFCVVFGLSMDYEVFLLSRMKEAWDRTGDNRQAVARGLERSGRIVSSAALIVVVVAGSFAFAEIVLIKAVGLGVAIAVALDATVVRALLVPSTMRLLGRWNWWLPARLQRWLSARSPVVEGA